MSAAGVQILDIVSRTAPLGARFYDPATRRAVVDGLTVRAYPRTAPQSARTLVQNAGGAHVLIDGPGLQTASRGDGSDTFWSTWTDYKSYVVEVRDGYGRFLPMQFQADPPHRGFFLPGCLASPPGSPAEIGAVHGQAPAGFVPLFSTPGRPVPANQAVIRAALRFGDDKTPASWCVLTAEKAGIVEGVGVADGNGDLAMLFPFPELDRRPFASGSPLETPPPSQSLGLVPTPTVAVTLRAFYEPAASFGPLADFCVLFNQAERVLARSLSPSQPVGAVTLQLGRELWLATEGSPYLHVI